jgi:hypothetical protein
MKLDIRRCLSRDHDLPRGRRAFPERVRDRAIALRAAAGLIVISVGVPPSAARYGPRALDIVANGLLVGDVGLIWSAIRAFEHRTVPLPAIFAGTVVWLVACAVPSFYAVVEWRVALLSLIAAAYSFAAAFEFWRGRGELPRAHTRWRSA